MGGQVVSKGVLTLFLGQRVVVVALVLEFVWSIKVELLVGIQRRSLWGMGWIICSSIIGESTSKLQDRLCLDILLFIMVRILQRFGRRSFGLGFRFNSGVSRFVVAKSRRAQVGLVEVIFSWAGRRVSQVEVLVEKYGVSGLGWLSVGGQCRRAFGLVLCCKLMRLLGSTGLFWSWKVIYRRGKQVVLGFYSGLSLVRGLQGSIGLGVFVGRQDFFGVIQSYFFIGVLIVIYILLDFIGVFRYLWQGQIGQFQINGICIGQRGYSQRWGFFGQGRDF